jgi:drug/metabolite transporter (DMT)-like permease
VTASRNGAGWSGFAPALFVLLWSTGFIGAKLGVPFAEPFTFLCLRFAFVILLMLPLALLLRARWPATAREAAHIAVAGMLIQGAYLGGTFAAIYHGMPAGLVSLIVGLQPVVTAFAAVPLLGERVTRTQWIGLGLGFSGVLLVMWEKIGLSELDAASVGWALTALLSITSGTVYQKRYCASFDLRAGSVIQFTAALLLLLPLALFTETREVRWNTEFVFALAWLVLVLSIGAISLLFHLIEHGEATRVSSLFYLTPLSTAAMAWLAFGEVLNLTAMIGMIVGIAGVALVVRKPNLTTPEP